MKRKIRESQDIESIHIGKIIEDELRRQERSVTWLSRKIHCDRRNIYDIFSRTSIDTDLLYRLCVALQKDFFTYFSTNLQSSDYQSITPPRLRRWIPCNMSAWFLPSITMGCGRGHAITFSGWSPSWNENKHWLNFSARRNWGSAYFILFHNLRMWNKFSHLWAKDSHAITLNYKVSIFKFVNRFSTWNSIKKRFKIQELEK